MIPSATNAPSKVITPSAADALPSAADALSSGAADALPSAADAPKPINEPITKPINETISDFDSDENVKTELTAKEKRELLVNDLFSKWLELSGQKLRSPKKRLAQINARLDDGFTPEEIIEAMTYVATDSWHVASGHNVIELAIRSVEQIESKLIKVQALKNTKDANRANNQSANSQPNNRANRETSEQFEQRMQSEFNEQFGI